MQTIIKIHGALFAIFVSLASAPAQNLIVNGSFEDYGGFSDYTDKHINLNGWTIGNRGAAFGGLDVVFSSGASGQIGPYWQANDGQVSVSLNWGNPGDLSQSIATIPGATYHLLFFMAAEVFGGPPTRTMNVLWDGVVQASPSFQYTGQGPDNLGWTQIGLNVVGTGNDVIMFSSTTPANYGPALDHVSLVAVPEPSALAFGYLAATLYASSRRRITKAQTRRL